MSEAKLVSLSVQISLDYPILLSMGNLFRRLVFPPTFPDREQTRAARWIHFLILTLSALIVADVAAILLGILDQEEPLSLLMLNTLGLVTFLGVWLLMRRGHVKLAALVLLVILFTLVSYVNALVFQSIRTPSAMTYIALVPLAGLLVGRRKMILIALLCLAIVAVIFYFEWTGAITPAPNSRSIVDDWVVLSMAIGMNTFLLSAMIRRSEESAEETRQTAVALAAANQELLASQAELQQAHAKLEDRVRQRTEELREINTQLHTEIEIRTRAEERLTHDAVHDGLTDLPNRVLFMDRLRHAIEFAKRRADYAFAALFLDLDSFKTVNDSLGHAIGDRLLIAIAQRIQACLSNSDTIARLGGDEFVVLLEDTKDDQAAIRVANQIQETLKSPLLLGGHQIFAPASIGIVANAREYDDPEAILRDADIAMYQAKSLGKARSEVFRLDMRERAMARLELENDLRLALSRGELELYYQPILSLETDSICGFEALIRWHHARRGLVSPAEFIPVAEETGLIVPIGHWIFQEASRQLRKWQIQYSATPPLTMSVNISASQFFASEFIEQVEQTLREIDLAPYTLRLEITERIPLETSEKVLAVFKRLHDLGIHFYIDDFGTGYSSLSTLQYFPIQTIKIDRVFVSRLDHTPNNTDIIRAVIDMAHDLGMDAVAEGIETTDQLRQLKKLKCDYGQGYLFSRPVNVKGAESLLNTPNSDHLLGHPGSS